MLRPRAMTLLPKLSLSSSSPGEGAKDELSVARIADWKLAERKPP